MSFISIAASIIAAVAICSVGCGYAGEDIADARKGAMAAYNKASTSFDAKDFASAQNSFNEALQLGGLNADVYEDVIIKLTICKAATGNAAEALTELDKVAAGSPCPDKVNAARSYILYKLGKPAEARAAFAKARQYNPQVQEFKD